MVALGDDVDVVSSTAWQLLGGGLLLTPAALLVEGPPPTLGTEGLVAMAYVTLVATALAGPTAKLLQQTLIRPSVFRLVAAQLGYTPDRPLPKALDIAGGLRYLEDGRVCAAKSKKGPCLLTFAREGDTWRLVSIDAPVKDLKL